MMFYELCSTIVDFSQHSQMLHGAGIFTYIYPKNGEQFCRCAYSSTMVRIWDTGTIVQLCLLGGLEHEFYDFPIILGISSSQLTNSTIFQRGRYTTSIYWEESSSQLTNSIIFQRGRSATNQISLSSGKHTKNYGKINHVQWT